MANIKVKVQTVSAIKKIVGQGELEISLPKGSTMKTLLSWMAETWGERLSSYLTKPGGTSPLPHIRIMVNGQDIGFLNGMDTALQDGDEILIIPPVGGG